MSTPTITRTGTVRITRTFHAPVKKVWKAWTDEDTFKKWWGPKEYTSPAAKLDVRVGGTSVMAMRSKDGQTIWSSARYREVIPEQRLVYVDSFSDEDGNPITPAEAGMSGDWPGELVVTITFTEKNGATVMDLIHEGFPPEMVADCTQGWNESFDKLKTVAEGS